MKKTAAQLDAEIAEALGPPPKRLHWGDTTRYVRAADLTVGDVILAGSVPPYTAYEVTTITPAPRRRLQLHLVRPDRTYAWTPTVLPTDTFFVDEPSRAEPTGHATRRRSSPDARAEIERRALEIIEGTYARFAAYGSDREPCLTVGLITDHMRQQAGMPDDFRFKTKERQRELVRSVLESMRRRGVIGSSFGARARCYEPKR